MPHQSQKHLQLDPISMAPQLAAESFKKWVDDCAEKGSPLSNGSQRTYGAMWNRFCVFVHSQGRFVRNVDAPLIERFLAVGAKKPFDEAYQRRYLQLLRDILRFLFQGRRQDNPAEELLILRRKQGPLAECKPVFLNQFEEHTLRKDLLVAPIAGRWMRLRDWAMLQVILGTGIKPSEVIALDLRHLTRVGGPKGHVIVIDLDVPGGAAARQVELSAWAQPALEHWLEARQSLRIEGDVLFPAARNGRRLTTRALYRVTSKTLTAAKLAKGHKGAQVLRATFAVRNIANGSTADTVQKWMGITSIERYRGLADGKTRPV